MKNERTKSIGGIAEAVTDSHAIGNAAAMRKAMEFLRDKELYLLGGNVRHCIGLTVFGLEQTCKIMRGIIEDALAAPPRNCDRFADELDAQLAFLNEVWLISIDRETMTEQDMEKWTDEMRTRYGRWLLAPAMEGNRKSVSIHCTKTGIRVDGANNIGSTSDGIVSCKRHFMRVCSVWWNTYCGRDEEDAPLRNCDVGTAEEQAERFKKFCEQFPCTECTLIGKTGRIYQCALAWAQMPYESEAKK